MSYRHVYGSRFTGYVISQLSPFCISHAQTVEYLIEKFYLFHFGHEQIAIAQREQKFFQHQQKLLNHSTAPPPSAFPPPSPCLATNGASN